MYKRMRMLLRLLEEHFGLGRRTFWIRQWQWRANSPQTKLVSTHDFTRSRSNSESSAPHSLELARQGLLNHCKRSDQIAATSTSPLACTAPTAYTFYCPLLAPQRGLIDSPLGVPVAAFASICESRTYQSKRHLSDAQNNDRQLIELV
jgi:hypothetical protein